MCCHVFLAPRTAPCCATLTPYTIRTLPGKTLQEEGEIDASISQYRMAIELKHDLSSAWVNLGVGLSKAGRDDEAMDAYEVINRSSQTSCQNSRDRGALVQTTLVTVSSTESTALLLFAH